MPSAEDTLSTLNWLVEAGADEAIGDAPVDRFVTRPPRGEVDAQSRRTGEATSAPIPKPLPPRPTPSGEGKRLLANITPANTGPLGTDGYGSAVELAAVCQSLPQLRDALESFEGSQLKKLATNTVFADGNPDSQVLFIGEAPGRDEDAAGLPFVGRAGKLLDQMLKAINLDRTSSYIINVMPWRPPDNRNPDPAEVAVCIPFLRRHIELARPKVMILLGAVAARHVMGLNDGIMKLRGRWLDYRIGSEMIPVLPTLHPAYLLRQPAHKRLAWRDLQSLADRLDALGLNGAKDR